MSEPIPFTVKFGKNTISVALPLDSPVLALKEQLAETTGVEVPKQKLFLKGATIRDEMTLADLKVTRNSKLMLIGSTNSDIHIGSQAPNVLAEERKLNIPTGAQFSTEQLRIIEKGPPSDAVAPATGDLQFPASLQGVYNHGGVAVRLTLKVDKEELWISTVSSTQKIQLAMVTDVSSTGIPQSPGHLVVTLQLGENSKYHLYFFPRQFFNAFKQSVLPFNGFW